MPEEYYEEEAIEPRRRPKSGAVTAVAVVNFILGGLGSLCGLLLMVMGPFIGQFFGMVGEGIANQPPPDMPPEQAKAFREAAQVAGGFGTMIFVVAAVIVLFVSVTMILGGVGVVQRKTWGRILTLILGGISALIALWSLLQIRDTWPVLIIYGGYAALVFAVLLNKANAQEFR